MFSLGTKFSSIAIEKIDLLALIKDNIPEITEQIKNTEFGSSKRDTGNSNNEENKGEGNEINIQLPKLTNSFVNKYLKGKMSY